MVSDKVNKPAHYNQGPIECIDAMEIVLTAEEYRGFLKGNAIKYLWREENKGGIEDLRKAKWYLDRLIESYGKSLADIKQGGLRAKQVDDQPKWTPKIGDWVKINKPSETQVSATCWFTDMDKYHGQVIQVNQMEDGGVVHNNWGFLFEWLEPAEAPQQPSKQSPQLPDGCRWLEVGEVIRDGDKLFKFDEWVDCRFSVGDKIRKNSRLTIRRNRFEVGEKVVDCLHNRIGVVKDVEAIGRKRDFLYHVEMQDTKMEFAFNSNQIAPYIEDAK